MIFFQISNVEYCTSTMPSVNTAQQTKQKGTELAVLESFTRFEPKWDSLFTKLYEELNCILWETKEQMQLFMWRGTKLIITIRPYFLDLDFFLSFLPLPLSHLTYSKKSIKVKTLNWQLRDTGGKIRSMVIKKNTYLMFCDCITIMLLKQDTISQCFIC